MTKYLATAHYANADISCETYEIGTLMNFLSEHENTHQDVINADTGEVLYIGNNMGEPEPDPREEFIRNIKEVCEEFGATFGVLQ